MYPLVSLIKAINSFEERNNILENAFSNPIVVENLEMFKYLEYRNKKMFKCGLPQKSFGFFGRLLKPNLNLQNRPDTLPQFYLAFLFRLIPFYIFFLLAFFTIFLSPSIKCSK